MSSSGSFHIPGPRLFRHHTRRFLLPIALGDYAVALQLNAPWLCPLESPISVSRPRVWDRHHHILSFFFFSPFLCSLLTAAVAHPSSCHDLGPRTKFSLPSQHVKPTRHPNTTTIPLAICASHPVSHPLVQVKSRFRDGYLFFPPPC